ncbi:MAG: FAD-dependent oxidoreductase [Gammaproteobacteria bacterium]|uniref:FAD-dependent oxidoreductase n=1 Tax=Rhodoferax sp. TaxID=50421 RepID=UPI0018397F23|nr:FAD-dependent oxidoreductase [Rhodoferax sp.]MBU3899029.1 FAD-dependent oxidoreductase [Gammaproteobacteria bacterium]MBA3057671.1 FAD-dependent oxidoreductase [Rhodoferax sp.]MBU3998247.1 FAD-dependent oxidoreductase [Gammaproteobacteria bacterium]MBU4018472.1 FAD-dependent oxidoreductase [Gammaproteobacteria bacterium]MBU4080484.1 FAD-dependent oxidoreductase [Gammaproteobacteria bacterium]
MKIAVIGAGIIGVTTAYELSRDGHEVMVLERRGAVAEEASFATGGIIAPDMPSRETRHFFNRPKPIRLRWPIAAHELAWFWKWQRARRFERQPGHRQQLQRLASYSLERLQQLTAELKLDYERAEGLLLLLRTEQDSKGLQASLQQLRAAGREFNELSALDARKKEPALSPDTPLFGAIELPGAEVANCRQFALLLKNECLRRGVEFAFNTEVTQLNNASGVTLRVVGDAKAYPFDAAVICAGADSARLLAPLGVKLRLASVQGYSISAQIREPLNAPRSGVVDQRHQVAITRLGNRVRVSGLSELGGVASHKRADALQTLYRALHDWFPGAAKLSSGVQEWQGARPMLADGLPVIGASGLPGLWLNLGHGNSGWAHSCGSARLMADLIAGQAPEMDLPGLGIERPSR